MALMNYPLDEYLILDEMRSEFRLQYVEGDIFAMSGGTITHCEIANNVLDTLRALPRDEYETYLSRLRLATPSGLYTYADMMVVYGEVEVVPGIRDTVTNPVFLVEILSAETADYDCGKKFEHYTSIPTLRDYLLIDQYTIDVEHRWRDDDAWKSAHYKRGDSFTLTGVPLTIAVDTLYEDVSSAA